MGPEFQTGVEDHDAPGFDLYGVPGPRIAPGTGPLVPQDEVPKARELYLLAPGQSLPDAVEEDLDHSPGLGPGQAYGVVEVLDEILFGHGHGALSVQGMGFGRS